MTFAARSLATSLSALIAAIVLFSGRTVDATALTYKIDANEHACFYAWVDQVGEKIAFYFAVQAGGSFDIDYTVKDHAGKIILDGERERQGDFVFTAQTAGEYSFCFSNDMSTFAEKIVDFEITSMNRVYSFL